ncbi:hypothetical protein GCM10025873_10020 [Demequina sediminis]|nr:hypothetical protein GCM10025873_10020 [Demequina sediminis]
MSLTVVESRWSGLGAGDGRLRTRDLTVRAQGRQAGRARLVTLTLDGGGLPARHGAGVPTGPAPLRALGGAA